MTQTYESNTATAPATGAALAGKYLTFCLGEESYGIAVLKIREIIRNLETTPVPQMPDYVRGVVNLRGKIIPVIDLRRRFGMGGEATGERTCIVVVQIRLPDGQSIPMGMGVDGVEEVVNIQSDELEPTPRFGGSLRSDYLLGMAKVKGRIKTLLDIDRVVSAEELAEVTALAE